MISARDIKSKIRTVRSIEQICRAMKTVASIRFRRAEQRLRAARPYRRHLARLMARVAAGTQEHPYLRPGPGERRAMVVVTSDRGLCGGYNATTIRQALQAGPPRQVVVVAVGRRGLVQMGRRGYEVADRVSPLGGEPDLREIARLADRIGGLYREGGIERVDITYARFLGGSRWEPITQPLLPISADESDYVDTIYEPELSRLLPVVADAYLRTRLVGAVMEASTSEHAARVAAMSTATDNSEEMIRRLTLDYNRARQAGITEELTEIVSAGESTG